jgi:hypothetical protein
MNTNLSTFLENFKGHLTTKQRSAIMNGVELTNRLERYAQQALGLRPDLMETKRNTIIWSPPGAGKTFTVRNVADNGGIDYVKYHGRATLNGFVMKMARVLYRERHTSHIIPVWIDDCDVFFSEKKALDFMKIVLDNDTPMISWDVNVAVEKARAAKQGKTDIVEALEEFDNGGVGIEMDLSRCRFIITTNKKLASKQEINKNKHSIDEHAVRDRCNWRQFDINSEEAWGWMASVMLSNNVFVDDGFNLDSLQMWQLLNTFYHHWDNLSANSMRTVKEAGSMLYNSPDTFADEFEQNFLG